MPKKLFNYVLAAILLLQLFTSFYYSSDILNQNTLYQDNKQKLNDLKDSHQFLTNRFTALTSLEYFSRQLDFSHYHPITETIDLNLLTKP